MENVRKSRLRMDAGRDLRTPPGLMPQATTEPRKISAPRYQPNSLRQASFATRQPRPRSGAGLRILAEPFLSPASPRAIVEPRAVTEAGPSLPPGPAMFANCLSGPTALRRLEWLSPPPAHAGRSRKTPSSPRRRRSERSLRRQPGERHRLAHAHGGLQADPGVEGEVGQQVQGAVRVG